MRYPSTSLGSGSVAIRWANSDAFSRQFGIPWANIPSTALAVGCVQHIGAVRRHKSWRLGTSVACDSFLPRSPQIHEAEVGVVVLVYLMRRMLLISSTICVVVLVGFANLYLL